MIMLTKQSDIGKNILAKDGVILPFLVKEPNFFLLFVFIAVLGLYMGTLGLMHNHFPALLEEMRIDYHLYAKSDFKSSIVLLTGFIFLFLAYKQMNVPGKFIVKQDVVELYAFKNFGFSVSDSKKTFQISSDKDFLSVKKIIKGKAIVSLNLDAMKKSGDRELFFNPFPSIDKANDFAVKMRSQLKLSTPVQMK